MKRIAVPLILILMSSFAVAQPSFLALPFVSYSTDFGAEYGLFSVAKNYLKHDESFTLILDFKGNGGNDSTFTASFPDKDSRHNTLYPIALDAEYAGGKAVNDKFFGIGMGEVGSKYTRYDNDYGYVRLHFPRTLKEDVIVEYDLTYNQNGFVNISQEADPAKQFTYPMQDIAKKYFVNSLDIMIDNRDSSLNPRSGGFFNVSLDVGVNAMKEHSGFSKLRLDLRKYVTVLSPKHLLAGRLFLTEVMGADVPIYEYATLGGRDTMRGYANYRFRGKGAALVNLEYRFPILSQLNIPLVQDIGGVVFVDTGKVEQSVRDFSLNGWALDYGAGLRVYLQDFVIRGDIGFGNEGMQVNFFYNHIF